MMKNQVEDVEHNEYYNSKIVKLLLGRSAGINAKNKEDVKLTKLLLERGMDVNAKDKNGDIPLHRACINGNIELVKLLLEHGANVNIQNSSGKVPLYNAIENDDVELAKLLLEHGANVNDYVYGWVLFYYVESAEMAKLLLEHGANPGLFDEILIYRTKRFPPDELTQIDGETAEYLLENGIVSARESSAPAHEYALINAVDDDDEYMIELLLKHGADPDFCGGCGTTPIRMEIEYGNVQIVKLMLKYCDDGVDISDWSGKTLLHEACECGRIQIVKLLLQNGANVNTEDKYGWTPLDVATKRGFDDIVKLLKTYEQVRGDKLALEYIMEFENLDEQ